MTNAPVITLIRHAESVSNAGGITQPHELIELSDRGRSQAHELAGQLPGPPSMVIVSGMRRAQQTAEPYCQRFGVEPSVDRSLDEFSVIDPALIAGLNGVQRKPFVKDYWSAPDPQRRLGDAADTFQEFSARVIRFRQRMDALPNATVIFGHGIWIARLLWELQGQHAIDTHGMSAFRAYQVRLPMPNCAVFNLMRADEVRWDVEIDRG